MISPGGNLENSYLPYMVHPLDFLIVSPVT